MQKKCLELSCYVCGAGAFGVFIRWLQDQMAFNDEGLVERSVFNFLVPLFILAFAIVFLRIVDKARNERYYLPETFSEALSNQGKLFTLFRWLAGAIMCAGSVLLLAESETDRLAALLRILAICGILSGISFPLLLTAANRSPNNPKFLCLLSFIPILMFAVWLICCYKMNDINSVVWAYALEIVTVVVAMLAFFYVAGFTFAAPSAWRSMFFSMSGCALCIMSLADERYMGMQLMLLASALMLVIYNWIMFKNLRQRKAKPKVSPDDGFERL